MFSDATCKLPMVEVNRFCTAPIEPRSLPICVKAKSIVWIASFAPDAVPILRVLTCLLVEVKAPPPVVANPAPISLADVDTATTEPNPTLKVSPALNVRDALEAYTSPTTVVLAPAEVAPVSEMSPPLARVYTTPVDPVATETP